MAATGIEARLIVCTVRSFTREQSLETAELAVRCAAAPGSHVAALDIAGDEAGYPLDPHVPAFDLAAAHGLGITAHAGEACGPESVRETLAALRPSRIGHGVRSIESAALVQDLAARRTHLEVCPSSNVQTNVCATYADHPVDRLCRAGLSIGIGTDTRTVTDVTLTEEYRRLAAAFGWTNVDFLQRNWMRWPRPSCPARRRADRGPIARRPCRNASDGARIAPCRPKRRGMGHALRGGARVAGAVNHSIVSARPAMRWYGSC